MGPSSCFAHESKRAPTVQQALFPSSHSTRRLHLLWGDKEGVMLVVPAHVIQVDPLGGSAVGLLGLWRAVEADGNEGLWFARDVAIWREIFTNEIRVGCHKKWAAQPLITLVLLNMINIVNRRLQARHSKQWATQKHILTYSVVQRLLGLHIC